MTHHAAFASLAHLFRGETLILICGLAVIVGYQILTGQITLKGIFADKSGEFSASRVQMLMTSVIVAGSYIANPHMISSSSHVGVSALLGGSNLFYLIQKSRLLSTQ